MSSKKYLDSYYKPLFTNLIDYACLSPIGVDILKNKCFVSGSSVYSLAYRENSHSDIDIYFYNKADCIILANEIERGFEKQLIKNANNPKIFTPMQEKQKITKHPNSYHVQLLSGKPFQLIHSYVGTEKEITNRFDFEQSTEYWTYNKDCYVPKQSRELKFNKNCTKPLSSLKRLVKFLNRGYTINEDEVMKMALTIASVEIKNTEDLNFHLGDFYEKFRKEAYNDFSHKHFDKLISND